MKRSKLPPAVLKLLPKGLLGGGGATQDGGGQSYILEKSVVDLKEGKMETESRNLEWTGVLSVVERQIYKVPQQQGLLTTKKNGNLAEQIRGETTDVTTIVTFKSRFGQAKLLGNKRRSELPDTLSPDTMSTAQKNETEDESQPKKGFFSSWSTNSLQRTIEAIGVRRTRDALVKSKEGMNVVLERLREGGLKGVLDGMRKDQELVFGAEGPWKRVWQQSRDSDERPTMSNDPFEDD